MRLLVAGVISFSEKNAEGEKEIRKITPEPEEICATPDFEGAIEEAKKIIVNFHQRFQTKPDYTSCWEIILINSIFKFDFKSDGENAGNQ
jgi:hypothetical protein